MLGDFRVLGFNYLGPWILLQGLKGLRFNGPRVWGLGSWVKGWGGHLRFSGAAFLSLFFFVFFFGGGGGFCGLWPLIP